MTDFLQFILLAVILYVLVKQNKQQLLPVRAKQRKLVLDTCALIDGRILDINRLGFVPDELIVPDFVIDELQLLADGNDAHKRERARYGLDVVKELQSAEGATVVIDRSIKSSQPTDAKLVTLAKNIKAQLYTTDFNLNKVAEIEGVTVLNVNELAQELRPVALPGERKHVKIVQKGSNPRQGVGYMEDGTMVVVDDAASSINKIIEVEVTRLHQTSSGKMIFASKITKAPVQAQMQRKRLPKEQPLVKRFRTKRIS